MKFDLEVRLLDDEDKAIPVTVGLADFARWCEHTGATSYQPLLADMFDLGWAYVAWAALSRTGRTSDDYDTWQTTVSSVRLVNPGKAQSRTRSKSTSRT